MPTGAPGMPGPYAVTAGSTAPSPSADTDRAAVIATQRAFLDPTGRKRTRVFDFTQGEIDVASALSSAGGPTTLDMSRSKSVRDGLVRLLDRGLVNVKPGSPAALPAPHALDDGAPPVQPVHVAWASVEAESIATRHMVRHFSHGSTVQSVMLNRVVRSTTGGFTDTEIALVLAWHYRHSDVHGLRVNHNPAQSDLLTVAELRHSHPDYAFTVETEDLDGTPVNLDVSAADDYNDKGNTMPFEVYDYFIRTLASRYEACRIDFDTLRVLPVGYQPSAFDQTLPALAQDALAYFEAPAFDTPQQFLGWVENALIISLPCGQVRHRIRLDPHTHVTSPYPNTEVVKERHAAEHMLLAFTVEPVERGGLGIGCQNAAWAVEMFGDHCQYASQGWGPQQASSLAAARTLARTAQYLLAGVNPKAASQFLRLGLRADQAKHLVALQAEDPDGAKSLLAWWAKFHWQGGPVTVDQVPAAPSIPWIDGLNLDGLDDLDDDPEDPEDDEG